MPTPEITAALQAADDAIGRLDQTLAGRSDGDLHLAHRDGGWTRLSSSRTSTCRCCCGQRP